MKDIIKLKDFLDSTCLSNSSFALDEEHDVFVGSKCVEKDNSYQTKLYLTDSDTMRQLTSHEKEQLYLWDDNETALFANMRDEEDRKVVENGEEKTCFYRTSIHGGGAAKALIIPLQATSTKKAADGEYVFCVDYHLEYFRMYQMNADERNEILQKKKDMQDYEVPDELPFYGNGMGHTGKKRNSLFLHREHDGDVVRVSEETCNAYDVELSDNHETVHYTGESHVCKLINKEGVHAYYRNTEEYREVLPAGQWSTGRVLLWKDNIMMLASGQKRCDLNESDMFYQLNPKSGAVGLFASYEDAVGSSVGSDCRYGGGKSICLYKDTAYFITTLFNRSSVCALHSDGSTAPVYDREGSVDAIALAKNCLYFAGM